MPDSLEVLASGLRIDPGAVVDALWSSRAAPAGNSKEAVISARVFVGNLNYETTQSEVETLFSQAGDIVEVFLPTDRNTGRPRGFAFVEFANEEAAAEAIEKFNGFELQGRKLRVNEAEERRPRPRPSFTPGPVFDNRGSDWSKPKGSRRNIRGRKRSL